MSELPPQFFLRKSADSASQTYVLVDVFEGESVSFGLRKNTQGTDPLQACPVAGNILCFRRQCVRQSSKGPRYMESMFCYCGYVVRYKEKSIPIWDMLYSSKLLPSRYRELEAYPAYQFLIQKTSGPVGGSLGGSLQIFPTCRPPESHSQKRTQENVLTHTQQALRTYCQTHRDDCCPITMEPLLECEISLTPCGHGCRTEALLQWLVDHPVCPVCRAACQPDALRSWS